MINQNLYKPTAILELLNRHGFTFRKRMGQNFLTAYDVAEKAAATVDKTCGVLEIGPGHGALTAPLCEHAGKVVAAELDERLLNVLKETLAGYDNVRVILADAMELDLTELCREEFAGLTPCVCANLPYNITTPVLTKLISHGGFRTITVMVQKEVTARLTAVPGEERYGVLPALLRGRYTARVLCDVPAGRFYPPPHVDSAVVTLERLTPPVVPEGLWDRYARVITAAFAKRRKTMTNALTSAGIPNAAELLTACGYDPRIRGEMLDAADFVKLAERI